jgi:hypothetical protein
MATLIVIKLCGTDLIDDMMTTGTKSAAPAAKAMISRAMPLTRGELSSGGLLSVSREYGVLFRRGSR